MSALHGAVALIQMHHVAVMVANDLHLDVPWPLYKLLQEQSAVAERRLRLRTCSLERILHFLVHNASDILFAEAKMRPERTRVIAALLSGEVKSYQFRLLWSLQQHASGTSRLTRCDFLLVFQRLQIYLELCGVCAAKAVSPF